MSRDFSYAAAKTPLDIPSLAKTTKNKVLRERLHTAIDDGWDCRIVTNADLLAVTQGCWFSQEHADKATSFIEKYVRHVTGAHAGKPFLLLDWQRFDLEALFGWIKVNELDPDGEFVRRFRRAYIEIPKKNGKTTMAAALGLYLLIGDGENNPQVFTAATTRAQAGLCFKTAMRMARESPDIAENVRVMESTHKIKCLINGGEMHTMSSEAGNEEGVDASGMIIDELHAHKSRTLYDCLRYAGQARSQPLTVVITTAGVYNPQSIGWEVHKQAIDIIEGNSEDTSLFARVYCADISDDLSDEATWTKANPSLTKSFRVSDFRDSYNEAIQYPDKWNNFCRYLLNIWSNAVDCWLPIEPILSSVDQNVKQEILYKKNSKVDCTVVGIDLATTRDLGAVVLLQRLRDGTYRQKEWYFAPSEQMEVASGNSNRDLYKQWSQDEHLISCPGPVIDYRAIYDLILRIDKEVCTLDMIGVDPWNATQLITDLTDVFGKKYVHSVRQGYVTMSPTMKQFENILLQDRWRHPGNPITAYCFNNCGKKDDGRGNIMPYKVAVENKIDGVSATLTALNCTMYLDNVFGDAE